MSGISGISGMTTGGMPQAMNRVGSPEGAQTAPVRQSLAAPVRQSLAAPVQQNLSGVEASSSQTLASLSRTSINASSESLIAGNGPILADDKSLGLAVLLLTLECLQSNDDEEKKGLLGLMLALMQQQQGGGDGGSLAYNSSSLSIESTQMQVASTGSAISAYSAGTMDPQQADTAAPGAAGLDVSA